MRGAALLLILGGCDQLFDLDHLRKPDPESDVDASLGVLIDAPSTCSGGAFYGRNGAGGTGLLSLCELAGLAPLELKGEIDTTDDMSCDEKPLIDNYDTELCVKRGSTVRIESIHATGTRPLVIVATDAMLITGTIDVSSKVGSGNRGAGGNWGGCQMNNSGQPNGLGGAGGAGGSFSTRGGDGGQNGLKQWVGSRSPWPADRVRGGCQGGNGGDGAYQAIGGAGGKSGGAVYLIAGTTLTLSDGAIINASGMGGRGGAAFGFNTTRESGGGGGGGGSGGLIGLDAPTITSTAQVAFLANGGGGASGGGVFDNGNDGHEPSPTAIYTPAAGGTGTSVSGKGGAGAARYGAGSIGGSNRSGGGGGGGLGYIVIYTTGAAPAGTFSPQPVL